MVCNHYYKTSHENSIVQKTTTQVVMYLVYRVNTHRKEEYV